MKSLFISLMLSAIAVPALAYDLAITAKATGASSLTTDELGRRSGRCPHRPEEPLIDDKSVSREGSVCGGV